MSKPFDILDQLGRFGAQRNISLRDPSAPGAFADHVSQSVGRALADPALMHGQRSEAMFEALVVSLGEYRLLTREDGGNVFPAGQFVAPDFRVVLPDGRRWLVEVKNVYEEEPFEQSRTLFRRDYHAKLDAYARATGAELKLAVFWARWSIWTLVSPDRLVDADGSLTLDMMTAMRVNEMAALGDMSIGTRAPLTLRLIMDPDRSGAIGDDGLVKAMIGGTSLRSEDREILDPAEREIAFTLMQHGQWVEQEPVPIIDGDRLVAMEFTWRPQEEEVDQGFDFIGSLSRIFAHYYAAHTLDDREVVQLRAPLRPSWFAPLIAPGYVSDALPLWRFSLKPNYGSSDTAADDVGGA
jgi:hypothetical protein